MPVASVVPDVNVLVSAAINRSSPPGRIRAAWRRQELMFVTSPAIIRKLGAVLRRPDLARYNITETEIIRLLQALHRHAIVTPGRLNLEVVKGDPEDNTILAAAVEGWAECIISGDAHLKRLGQHEHIPILSPAEFVEQYAIPS